MEYEVRRITKLMRFDVNRKIKQIYDFSKKDYYVDTDGNLYYRREKLVDIKNNFGYITNTIKDNDGIARTFSRQQIVAQTFLLDSFEEGMTVDHINRVRHDNRLENLRWSTAKQQIHNQTRKIHRVTIMNNVCHQLYLDTIPDQRLYFIENNIPKFNKKNYRNLKLIYEIYDSIINNYYIDDIISNYVKTYISLKNISDSIDRADFYDYFYSKIKTYYNEKSNSISSQTSLSDILVRDFKNKFDNKKYVKKELKKYCIENFNLENEIFKNKESINIFLENIGFKIIHKRNGDYIEKI